MIIYVTGGARSGKSAYAERRAKEMNKAVVYIATGVPFDDGMKDRIKKHQLMRPASWQTIEQYKNFKMLDNSDAFLEAEVIVFDCLTIMITNLMMDSSLDFDIVGMDQVNELEKHIAKEVDQLVETIRKHDKTMILVSNEVGMGLVPFYRFGNYFRDIAGRMNQKMAQYADEVIFTVSGIPMVLKSKES